MEQQNLLNEHEAAKLLRVSVQLLRKWRASGSGPEHIKLGKCVRYSVRDVEGFIASKRHRADEPMSSAHEQVH
jgi:hypothetical protein